MRHVTVHPEAIPPGRRGHRTNLFPFLWLFVGLLLSAQAVLAQRTLVANQTDHPLDAYAIGALRIALEEMPDDYSLKVTREPINQTRAIEFLETRQMDVMWLASTREYEEQLRPIRFPLLKGLLGHRVFIINPESQSNFNRVDSFEDLKRLSFGQGAGWPDIEILRSGGLEVITTSKYRNLFFMVEGGRFDGFPRGLLEPWTEINNFPELGLTVEDNIVLIYRLPFYFFVRPDDAQLADALKQGLDKALANGRFDQYFYNHPLVKEALNQSNLAQRQAFHLDNPLLTAETPVDRGDYWIDLDNLEAERADIERVQ